MGNSKKIRVDEDFYRLWKKSGYSSTVFTKKLIDELYEDQYKRKKNNKEWIFNI
jgi:hypothetical protein